MRSKDRGVMERMKAFAEEYAREHGGSTPSTAEFGRRFKMTRQSAFRYLQAMDRLGMIQYEDGKVITDLTRKISMPGRLGYSFQEGITAGSPTEIEGQVDAIFAIPPIFVDNRSGDFFVLRVRGDSMLDAGIEPDDLVICRQQETAREGEIVAAYIRGEGSTLKRFSRDDRGPFLQAVNDQWPPEKCFFGREFDIQGVAIKILKDGDWLLKRRSE